VDAFEVFRPGVDLPSEQALREAAGVGASKPDQEFFARVRDASAGSAGEIVYVGDNRDKDVVPAKKAGLRAVLIRRGP
jgi:N-acetyl-D-muramate 6-phosphate phosphatase